jgi:hypothetical protein
MPDVIQQEIDKCISFPEYLALSKAISNKVGFLILAFIRLHPHAPPEDLAVVGGRMAKIWVIASKDTGYLLKIIWDTSSANISGSHLNYIQGIFNKNGSVMRTPPRLEGHAGMRTE